MTPESESFEPSETPALSGEGRAAKASGSLPVQPFLYAADSIWIPVKDGNVSARALFRRHYSYKPYRDGRDPALFVGPGEKMVLLTADARALFVWRKFRSADGAGQEGVNCAIFRNESGERASDLIRAAMAEAWKRWPGERLFTYVNPRKIKSSRQPGRCFIKAGWTYVTDSNGHRKLTRCRRLPILEVWPRQNV